MVNLKLKFNHGNTMCGVIGIINIEKLGTSSKSCAHEAYKGLMTLQHRGQDAAGILTYDFLKNKFFQHKGLGLASSIFSQEDLEKLSGSMCIGHTRYATTGSDGINDIQPLVTGFPVGLGMVHNGNVLNYHQLSKELSEELNHQLLTENDLELFMAFMCQALVKHNKGLGRDLYESLVVGAMDIFENAVGAYSLVGLVASEGMFALRDPNGIRPLILGKKIVKGPKGESVSYAVSSETVSLNFLGHEKVRDIKPGEMIFISKDGDLRSFIYKKSTKKPCMFEWVYFSGAESEIENRPVYGTRRALGEKLASTVMALGIKADIVCPVPDTARPAAIAMAHELGIPYREGLIKNRYVQRSFILNTEEQREKAVELKLSPIRSEIEGKDILLVDDSVVRGTTSMRIIKLLKKYGANKIHLAITCPPLRHGCFYGIDFPKKDSLVAHNRSLEEIVKYIGADSVTYLSEDNLKDAIGLSDMCMGCITGKYPTSMEQAEVFAHFRGLQKEEESRREL